MRWGGIFDLDGLRLELERLDHEVSKEGFWDDQERAQATVQERSAVQEKVQNLEKVSKDSEALLELLELAAGEGDEGMLEELASSLPPLTQAVRQLEVARMLSGPQDALNAIVTVHPGAGGVDAQDWAEMLMRMYLRWSEGKQYGVDLIENQPGDEAGIKSASFLVKGTYAYGRLRAESGVHRLIRISPFDANARRHTAFAAVYVVPDLEEDNDEIEVKSEDLRVDTYRASGAGGQHVNRTESAIRLTHIPTGIVVQCQAERSQHKNRATAMKMLRGRLFEKQRQEQEEAFAKTYGSDRMAIDFGSQVRTYTLAPYRLVKDERTDYKTSQVDSVLDGDLDAFIETYLLANADNMKKTEEKEDDA